MEELDVVKEVHLKLTPREPGTRTPQNVLEYRYSEANANDTLFHEIGSQIRMHQRVVKFMPVKTPSRVDSGSSGHTPSTSFFMESL